MCYGHYERDPENLIGDRGRLSPVNNLAKSLAHDSELLAYCGRTRDPSVGSQRQLI